MVAVYVVVVLSIFIQSPRNDIPMPGLNFTNGTFTGLSSATFHDNLYRKIYDAS
jgi:hypothetical protein